MIYNSFTLNLWYKHCTVIVEITKKIQTSFKMPVCKKATTWRCKKPQSNNKIYLKNVFQLSQRIKTFRKTSCSITYTLEKKIFCSCDA